MSKYKVQFAYPVTSINPTVYDDWQSTFIGNHIYLRLLPEKDKPEIPYLTTHVSVSCQYPLSYHLSNACETIKILFKPQSFIDCSGKQYTIYDIKKEFYMLLKSFEWIVPHWKKCDGGKDTICVTGQYFPDQMRRLRATVFRFGWSKVNKSDKTFGSGPYCLHGNFDFNGEISSGILLPSSKHTFLPSISFHTSQQVTEDFHLAIYGNDKLIRNGRKNISVHTPLAYYVITHPLLAKYDLPWNQKKVFHIINEYLIKNNLSFSHIPNFLKFPPDGQALKNNNYKKYKKNLMFAIPNYLPECHQLANKLNEAWKKEHTKANCVDIINYVYELVIKRKKGWDGFLVGLSATDPSYDSIRHQYFSPNISTKSWTYQYPNPDRLFYRAGIGQTIVTIDSKKICAIKPNPLGLGDIFITDLIPCSSDQQHG